ncbi:putative ATP synthase subunit f, mitochondrial [Centruroides sculpturatus]|uniref:putative ATP synthase subunit f, mitochondrial n=1 Tax=Centruroides sculpturatus TaxID=218467 RepID=UPI000C6E8A06|nr:putative ATP synthase subunit f, mitochondrial [Centruroides sculpturatus]
MGFGDYPPEYNPKVHGPYDPARYYGKPDIPFGEVKLNEMGSWISRRNKSPPAIMGLFSRAFWRWQHKYIQPKRGGVAPAVQGIVGIMILFFCLNYGKLRQHRLYKYHW